MNKYRVIKDLQGGEFGMGRDMTASDWHTQDMEYGVTACEQAGLHDCHIEHIYDGIIWVDYDIIGTREEN